MSSFFGYGSSPISLVVVCGFWGFWTFCFGTTWSPELRWVPVVPSDFVAPLLTTCYYMRNFFLKFYFVHQSKGNVVVTPECKTCVTLALERYSTQDSNTNTTEQIFLWWNGVHKPMPSSNSNGKDPEGNCIKPGLDVHDNPRRREENPMLELDGK